MLSKKIIINVCEKVIEIFIYILIFCLPFSNAIIEISFGFIIFAWVIKKVLDWQPFPTYLNLPILVYFMANLASVIVSSNFSLSLINLIGKTSEYILLFLITAETASNKKILRNILCVMLASATLISIDSVFQYFAAHDFLRQRALEAGRITGSFHMPNDLAGYLGPVLCLFLAFSFFKFKKPLRYFLRIEIILLLILIIVIISRGAWLGLIAGVCFLGILENKKILFVTTSLLLILILALPYLINTSDDISSRLKSILDISNYSNLDRKSIWRIAILMIKNRPIFGHGLGTFMGNFTKFGKDYRYLKDGIIPYAHNCYLQIAAETGIFGLLSFLWIIESFLLNTVKSLKKIDDVFYHAALSGISAGIIVTLVHSLVDTNLYSLQLTVLFWFMLGLNAALLKNYPKIKNDRRR